MSKERAIQADAGMHPVGSPVCFGDATLEASQLDELRAWIGIQGFPPVKILKSRDAFQDLWGWERLLPYDFEQDPSGLPMYENYLGMFYNHHGCAASDHRSNKAAAEAAMKCLAMEEALGSEWKIKRAKAIYFDADLSYAIQKCMSHVVDNAASELRRPFVTYAANCISKEAELMIEWLRQGSCVPNEEYEMRYWIRHRVLDLAMFQGDWCVHAEALLLGITKEAQSMLDNARLGSSNPTYSNKIRAYGLAFLSDELIEYQSKMLEVSGEMEADDVSAVEVNQSTRDTENAIFGTNKMQKQSTSKINTNEGPKNIGCLVTYVSRPEEEEDDIISISWPDVEVEDCAPWSLYEQ